MPKKRRAEPSTTFEEAVESARCSIELMLPPGQKKIFAFPPGIDLSPSRLRYWTSTRERYDHLRLRLAATLRLQRHVAPNLSKAAAEILEGKRQRFQKHAPHELIIVIGMAVEEASKTLPTYRNEATDQQTSACDAVAQAATESGRKMTYNMVASRYKQYRRKKA